MEVDYLDAIQTPTHSAKFNLYPDWDHTELIPIYPIGGTECLSGSDGKYMKLKTIQLSSKANPNQVIKEVAFSLSKSFNYFFYGTEKRCRLDSITEYGVGGSAQGLALPPHRFEYNEYTETPYKCGVDPWGYFTEDIWTYTPDVLHADNWMLQKVSYPTGGSTVFEYEPDRFLYDDSFREHYDLHVPHQSINQLYGGGVRLKRKIDYDALGNSAVYQYTYASQHNGYGFASGIGARGQWYEKDTEEPTAESLILNNYTTDVHYPDITAVMPDGSKIKKYFTSAARTDLGATAEEAQFQLSDQHATILNSWGDLSQETSREFITTVNNGWKRGYVWKEEYLSNDNSLVKVVKRYYKMTPVGGMGVKYMGSVYSPYNISGSISGGNVVLTKETVIENGVAKTKEYEYLFAVGGEDNGLIKRIIEYTDDNDYKVTQIDYASEFGYLGQNMLSQVYSKTIKRGVVDTIICDENGCYWFWYSNPEYRQPWHNPYRDFKVLSKEWTPYQYINGAYRQSGIWKWIGNGTPNDTTAPDVPDNEAQMLKAFNYDIYGNVTEITDATGTVTKKVYGHKSSVPIGVFHNTGSGSVCADNFNDGSTTDNDPFSWSTYGALNASSGVLKTTGSAYAGNHTLIYQNFTADVAFKIVNDYGNAYNWAAIHCGSTSSDVLNTGYLIYYRSNGEIILYREGTNLVAVQTGLTPNNVWRRMSVTVNGTNIQVFIDGQRFVNYSLQSAPSSGYIGLYSYSSDVEFDDFRSYPIGALATSIAYDPIWMMDNYYADANGLAMMKTFDSFGRLQSVKDFRSGNTLADYAYDYSSEHTTAYSVSAPNYFRMSKFPMGNMLQQNWSFEQWSNGQPIGWGIGAQISQESDTYTGGKAIKIYQQNGNWAGVWQYVGTLKAGKTYTASVWFKAPANVRGQIFFGDAGGLHAYNNCVSTSMYGNDAWQRMSVTHTMSVDDIMSVYIYGMDNSGVLYDNVVVEEGSVPTQPISSITATDGLNRGIQSQILAPEGRIISATEYDALGRAVKTYKPYVLGGSVLSIDLNPQTNSASYYANVGVTGLGSYPYSEVEYYPDPLNRIKTSAFPGAVFKKGGANVCYSYGADLTNQWLLTTITDENGHRTDTYQDKGRHQVKVVSDPGGKNLTTRFYYDVLGNLEKSIPPSGDQASTYSYNTLQQLTRKTTPDAGTVSYLYDKKGNLRFVQDAKQAPDKFTYQKYDAFNRIVECGEYTGGGYFTKEKADSGSFPTNGTKTKEYTYDQVVYTGPTNVVGNLARTRSYDQTGALSLTTSYSYSQYGNIEWIVNQYASGSTQKLEYWYDLQGNVTKKGLSDLGNNTNILYTFYQYDQAGRLSKVYTDQNAAGSNKVLEATYSYFADGSVKRLQLGNAQGVDYTYNERGWLTQINHQNLNAGDDPGGDGANAVPVDKFGEVIGYNLPKHIGDPRFLNATPQFNGNISWLMYNINGQKFRTPEGPSTPLLGWKYSYDNVNRLTSALYGAYYNNSWNGTDAFNLSWISYDKNGNITSLYRTDESGGDRDVFSYTYQSSSNRLTGIFNNIDDGYQYAYTYDANGNMLTDSRNGISSITYNTQNLPYQLTKSNYNVVKHWYDGSGNRIRKQETKSSGSVESDEIYVLGVDGQTEAVYDARTNTLKFWNIIAGGQVIGRVEK